MKLLEPNWQELDIQDSEYIGNLHPVFDTKLDIFPDITGADVQGQIRLWDLLQTIKYNLVFDIEPSTFLLNKYVDGELNDAYDQKKKQLPATCYNARFRGYKDLKHVKSVTNLMFLDIDDFESKEKALEYKKEIIEKYEWILACNLSLSKLGLHVIVMVDAVIDNSDYNQKYKYISQKYFNDRLDKNSLSLTRYTVVPYDFNIYINESPEILDIDSIIRNDKKGTSSAYNCDTTSGDIVFQKGMSSAYNCDDTSHISSKQKGMLSAYKKREIICTAHTFLHNTSLEKILSSAARDKGLKFRHDADESLFHDVDIPIYSSEGIDVMEVNLHCYKNSRVKAGSRTSFIGALTIQMIYLNIESPDNIDKKIRKEIFKFILNVNNKHCDPPLKKSEVINSFNANFKKYQSGEIDFAPYFKKQRAFWSKQTNLKGNEKRKVTCRIKNAPIVEESKKKIYEAIEILTGGNEKITQRRVSKVSGLSISTVKKYWKEFKDVVRTNSLLLKKEMNQKNGESEIIDDICNDFDDDALDIGKDAMENYPNILKNPNRENRQDLNQGLTEEELTRIYNRVYSKFINKLSEESSQRLWLLFKTEVLSHTPKEQRLLLQDISEVCADDFWTYGDLESKLLGLLNEFKDEINKQS